MAFAGKRIKSIREQIEPGKAYDLGEALELPRIQPRGREELEARQLASDVEYLPELVRREGLIGLPSRFSQVWADRGYLKPAKVRQPKGDANAALIEGGEIALGRGDDEADFRPGVWTNLPVDSLFLLNFTVRAEHRPALTVTMRQSRDQD